MRAGLQALNAGIPQGYPDYVLHSLVKVMRGGEEVKISKRAGSYVTLRDLHRLGGARRGALLPASRARPTRTSSSTSTWRARRPRRTRCTTCSTRTRASAACSRNGAATPDALRQADLDRSRARGNWRSRSASANFRRCVAEAARELAPHSVAFYLRELAADFHSYYNAERILVEDEALRAARLALCAAVRQTLANGLSLLGVSAPEKM